MQSALDRQKLLAQSEGLTKTVQARIVRTGFTQWFVPSGRAPAPACRIGLR
jgi:hypothetical protein